VSLCELKSGLEPRYIFSISEIFRFDEPYILLLFLRRCSVEYVPEASCSLYFSAIDSRDFIPTYSVGNFFRSLLAQVFCDWSLDVGDLEISLQESGSTSLSAFLLVGRCALGEGRREETFLRRMEAKYLDVAFHNATHAAQARTPGVKVNVNLPGNSARCVLNHD
jgi:hypothetical protein